MRGVYMENEAVKRWLENRQKGQSKPDDEFLTMLEELHIPAERSPQASLHLV